MIGLARALSLGVTAEGIETAGQLAEQRAQGCDLGQGHYLSRPLASDAIRSLLAAPSLRLPGALATT